MGANIGCSILPQTCMGQQVLASLEQMCSHSNELLGSGLLAPKGELVGPDLHSPKGKIVVERSKRM